MNKQVTIGDEEFELVPYTNPLSSKIEDPVFMLKRLDKTEKDKMNPAVLVFNFFTEGNTQCGTYDKLLEKELQLTQYQARAMRQALEVLLEYVTEDNVELDDKLQSAADVAWRIMHDREISGDREIIDG